MCRIKPCPTGVNRGCPNKKIFWKKLEKKLMTRTISADPLTRIEGHLSFKVEVSDNQVFQVCCAGDMFRGSEVILKGRNPMEAQHTTQRDGVDTGP